MKVSDRISILGSEVIAQDESRYLSFPDVVLTRAGSLLAMYRDADIHYPADTPSTELVVIESEDQGRTWGNARIFSAYPANRPQSEFAWHCPRLMQMSDGRIAFLCDITQPPKFLPEIYISLSEDNGKSWSTPVDTGARGIMPDRLIELSETEWVFAYHWKDYDVGMLGEFLFATEDAGKTWGLRSKVGSDPRYSLCEASLIQLPDTRLVSYMRENSFLHLPTFVSISEDRGHTWSEAKVHPSSGHRPSAGVLEDGSVLLTYRNVAGQPGLSAWIGSADESFFSVSKKDLSGSGEKTTPEGILLCAEGNRWEGVEYTFPPIMDWEDTLELSVRLQRIDGDVGSCVLRAGAFLYVDSSEIRLTQRCSKQVDDEFVVEETILATHTLNTSVFHHYVLRLEQKTLRVLVDGNEVIRSAIVEQPYFRDRKVSFGQLNQDPPNKVAFLKHQGKLLFTALSYSLRRKDGEIFEYSWDSSDGSYPDQYQRENCFQIDQETCGDWEEAGYSGWIHIDSKTKFCIDYRRGESRNPYIVGHRLELKES